MKKGSRSGGEQGDGNPGGKPPGDSVVRGIGMLSVNGHGQPVPQGGVDLPESARTILRVCVIAATSLKGSASEIVILRIRRSYGSAPLPTTTAARCEPDP